MSFYRGKNINRVNRTGGKYERKCKRKKDERQPEVKV
jgi:hypothetical protein